LRIFFLIIPVALMTSTSACDAEEPLQAPREQLLEDQTFVIESVEALAQAIEPSDAWSDIVYPELGCVASDGRVKGYQTSYKFRLKSEAVGHDIDDAKAIDLARTWLGEQGYEFVLDEQHSDGLRQLRAVKEDDVDGIGISINAHPGIVAITGTSRCRP